jgi:hypothetical protein
MTINGDHPTLADAKILLPNAVFLPLSSATKKPIRRSWQKTSFTDTQKAGYQRLLDNAETVGVLVLPPLLVSDCDTEAYRVRMLELNPETLGKTLQSHGARGGAFWLWMEGNYPQKTFSFAVPPGHPLAPGLAPDPKTGLIKIGELRGGRCQCVICGKHPKGHFYSWPAPNPLICIRFSDIVWPPELEPLPWQQKAQKQSTKSRRTRRHPQAGADTQLLQEAKARLTIDVLWQHFGYPERTANPCLSPFRQEQNPSFSVYDEEKRWKDHGTEEEGDSFDFFQKATAKSASDAFREFVTLAGLGDRLRTARKPDPRPVIQHPDADRYVSEFATELGNILKDNGFYRFHGRPVYVCPQTEQARSGRKYQVEKWIDLRPDMFRTLLERYCRPLRGQDEYCSLPAQLIPSVLASSHLIEQLPQITYWTEIQTPVLPYLDPFGSVALSKPGYDARTGIYTAQDAPVIDLALSLNDAVQAWRDLMTEFCFPPDTNERERCISVALAAALTPFCACLLPERAKRPAFAVSANAEGAGKTLLLSFGMVARLGFVPTGAAPDNEDEMRKVLDSAVLTAQPILFFDNLKGHLNSGELEAFITSSIRRFRILGTTNYHEGENVSTVYITANFATYSPDLRRRLLAIELLLEEARAEDRAIKNYLDEIRLIERRSKLLSIFWALVHAWDQAERPAPSLILPSFEEWSKTVAAIIENARLVSPCLPAYLQTGGDTDTQDMERLVQEMNPIGEYRFGDLIELARDYHLFSWAIPPEGDLEPKYRSRLGKLFYKFEGRIFAHHYKFCRPVPSTAKFYGLYSSSG